MSERTSRVLDCNQCQTETRGATVRYIYDPLCRVHGDKNALADRIEELERERDLWQRTALKMMPAAGPAWTPRWLLDATDDDGNLLPDWAPPEASRD